VLLKRNPDLAGRAWFRWLAGSLPLPLPDTAFRNLGFAVLAAVLAFNIGTYSYYRGSVVTPFHSGPVSPTQHHFALSSGALLPDGGVKFHIYLDGGTPEAPAHIMKAELTGGENEPLETWNTETLTRLPADPIRNDFAYNKFKAGPYDIIAEMGAMATITLPPPEPNVHPPSDSNIILRLTDVNGRSFSLKLAGERRRDAALPHPPPPSARIHPDPGLRAPRRGSGRTGAKDWARKTRFAEHALCASARS
jgi:hypothetical protein